MAIIESDEIRKSVEIYIKSQAQVHLNGDVRVFIGLRKVGNWKWLSGEVIAEELWSRKPDYLTVGECAILVKIRDRLLLYQIECLTGGVGFICQTMEGEFAF